MKRLDFKLIAQKYVKSHTPLQCQLYWHNLVKFKPKDEIFTVEEEKLLIELAREYKNRNWIEIGKKLVNTFIIVRTEVRLWCLCTFGKSLMVNFKCKTGQLTQRPTIECRSQ
ncbi:hypothetical protein RF11_13667 [Thelohanellus kitauei]|uniref:Uncharacterized protein n=1 Tax=Thelohanellus kitauei TaxID=669202 RepID=A0A0C2NG54_THEKT|nr:hypothetical protein RF11_13667 [Thelohanellus kitauei]